MKEYDVVIIGGGPAGYSAALYNARNARSVLVIEQLSAGGQMATTGKIDNYPGFEEGIDGFELAEKMQSQAERFGVETTYETVLEVKLDNNPKEIVTNERSIFAKSVIMAMGAHPRELGIQKESQLRGRGIAYCATCDGMMFKDKDVVIVGGGNSAIADALFLSKICHKVTLIHRRDNLRASRVYQEQLEKSSIEFVWNSKVIELLSKKRLMGVRVENLKTGQSQVIHCDGLFVAIGRVPDTEFVKGQLELDKNGYIIADESTRTNREGVFAIGDVRTKALRQIVTAVADGANSSFYVEHYLLGKE